MFWRRLKFWGVGANNNSIGYHCCKSLYEELGYDVRRKREGKNPQWSVQEAENTFLHLWFEGGERTTVLAFLAFKNEGDK